MFSRTLLLAALTSGALAQSSMSISSAPSSTSAFPSVKAQTTVNLFIDAQSNDNFIGEVVDADSCETTMKLRCTAGGIAGVFSSTQCDPSVTVRTPLSRKSTLLTLFFFQYLATYGPDSYEYSSETVSLGTTLIVAESCSVASDTAVCSASIGVSAGGQHTQTASVITRSGNEVNTFQVPITAGADKLRGLAKCTATGNAAAPTAVKDVYKVLVPAALMAGALL